jgi:hypothetical protein
VAKTKEIFRGLNRERRGRIIRAVYRGEVLRDPEDAAVAVRCARAVLENRSGGRRALRSLAAAGAFVYIALELFLYLHGHSGYSMPTWPAVVLSFYLFTHVYGWFASRRIQDNARRAERLNLQLTESAGLTLEEPPANAVETYPPQTHSGSPSGSDRAGSWH